MWKTAAFITEIYMKQTNSGLKVENGGLHYGNAHETKSGLNEEDLMDSYRNETL